MQRITAAESAVTIWFSGEEPPAAGRITALVERALAAAGLPFWAAVEADCFRAGSEVLVLARPGHGRRYFSFPGPEELRAGAAGCAGTAGGLYRNGGGYILAVPAAEAGPGLYEFGALLSLSEDWEAHAREQGLCLRSESALDYLRRQDPT